MIKKTALITGATGGIGEAVGRWLLLRGYELSLLSRTIPFQDTYGVLSQQCNVVNIEEVDKAIENTINKFGKIDVLVNYAGVSSYGIIEERPDLSGVYDVNVIGTINACISVLPSMKSQKSGYIINIGSLRGIQYSVGKAAYSMSKAAVIAFSKTLKEEVAEYGIKVTVINPGFVDISSYDSAQRDRITPSPYKDIKIKSEALVQPDDIAKTVLYLLDISHGVEISELNIGRLWEKQ